MARTPCASIESQMTRTERILGWCWLPVYLFLLSFGLNRLFPLLGLPSDAISINIAYFAVNLLFVLIVFRRFLLQRFFGKGFWDFLQALVLGAVLHYAGTWLIQTVVTALHGEFAVINNVQVEALAQQNRPVMLIVGVLLAPLIEETLVRGIVFGSFYGASGVLAYLVSGFVFIFMHNWVYFETYSVLEVLLSCLPYIPACVALAWVYEKSGSIWCSILLHALINAVSFGLIPLF